MSVNLPTVLTEDTHFYKKYENELKHLLGKYYISYSTINSWFDYRPDFIKQKFLGIRLPSGVYADMGNFLGEAVENGFFSQDNPHGFIGQENVDLNKYRKPDAEYEKLIIIDRGEYFMVGFIDIYYEQEGKKYLEDNKSGGANKEKEYASEDYLQTVFYNYALGGDCVTGVNFFRREGSHVRPPLKLGKEQFYIPVEYNESRVKKALAKLDLAVKEISEIKKVFDKYFG